jgi:2-polyprenyl-3-methyl-5-hydroxy-6-metoxy-1,4-benzoquinol methylase
MSNEDRLQELAEHYTDKVLHGWLGLYKEKQRRLFNIYRKYLVGTKALEMGVSDGEMTQYIVPEFKELTIIDGAKEHLESTVARIDTSALEKFESVHGMFEDYKPEVKFDTIFMCHILEHLERAVEVLQCAKSWLSPGGRIIMVVPNANSLHRHIGVKLGLLEKPHSLNEQDKLLGHVRVYYPQEFRQHVTDAGLTILKFGGLMVKPLSNRQIEKDWSQELQNAYFEISDDFPELCSEMYIIAEAPDS